MLSSECVMKQPMDQSFSEYASFNSFFSTSFNKLTKSLSKYSNLIEVSQDLRFESAIFAIMVLLHKYKDNISIRNSILTIKIDSIGILEKLNFYLEFLCHIPFTFEYDDFNDEFYYDFSHLDYEIQKILYLAF
jgi:hypothetical protein